MSSASAEPLLAVVVGGVDLGEADRIARLLSAERGRVDVMVRRARASKRSFVGLSEVGNQVELSLRQGRGDLPLVTGGRVVRAPTRARERVERVGLLAYGCELCAALAPESHGAPRLTRLLEVWLELLEGQEDPGVASRLALEAKALTFAGLTPTLARCARCGQELDGACVFDPEEGGVLHDHCGGGAAISARTALYLEALRRTPLAQTPGMPAPAEATWLLADFAQHQLGRALRSRGFLEDLGALG